MTNENQTPLDKAFALTEQIGKSVHNRDMDGLIRAIRGLEDMGIGRDVAVDKILSVPRGELLRAYLVFNIVEVFDSSALDDRDFSNAMFFCKKVNECRKETFISTNSDSTNLKEKAEDLFNDKVDELRINFKYSQWQSKLKRITSYRAGEGSIIECLVRFIQNPEQTDESLEAHFRKYIRALDCESTHFLHGKKHDCSMTKKEEALAYVTQAKAAIENKDSAALIQAFKALQGFGVGRRIHIGKVLSIPPEKLFVEAVDFFNCIVYDGSEINDEDFALAKAYHDACLNAFVTRIKERYEYNKVIDTYDWEAKNKANCALLRKQFNYDTWCSKLVAAVTNEYDSDYAVALELAIFILRPKDTDPSDLEILTRFFDVIAEEINFFLS